MTWRNLRPYVIVAAVALAVAIVALALRVQWARQKWEGKKDELRAVAARAEPIIDALWRYRQERAVYPDALEDLVPDYVPSVPGTGPPFSAAWGYSVAGNGTVYDLYVRVPHDYCPWPINAFSFGDYYVYRSTQAYAREEYGGVLEAIDEWAYYHE